VIEYRSFHNSDPPRIVALWHAGQLGRGAAEGFTTDAFETLIFAQPYFERTGLIVACEGSSIVGFVHAGFGPNADETWLDRSCGVICAVLVHPNYRRQGIGRKLVALAEDYLRRAGARTLFAGAAAPRDPFYFGLYGGSQPAGFLQSDAALGLFFPALGYEQAERWLVYQRDMNRSSDPMSFRLATHRRKTQLLISDQTKRQTWWWITRFGRLESLQFLLVPKGGGQPLASLSVVGLDLYLRKWNERAVGLLDLQVESAERKKGYGQAILVEVCRRLKTELITKLEAHALDTDVAALAVLKSAAFEHVDTGIVYRRSAS
jgi:ribosomal protein S18 acetylase RimI-like enzyme